MHALPRHATYAAPQPLLGAIAPLLASKDANLIAMMMMMMTMMVVVTTTTMMMGIACVNNHTISKQTARPLDHSHTIAAC